MNNADIKRIVRLTIEELADEKLLDLSNYCNILRAVEVKLINHFTKKPVKKIDNALKKISSDPYFEIITGQYEAGLTLEQIAEDMDVDISTIKRNKKRLILMLNKEV